VTVVHDAIAEMLAEEPRVQNFPAPPLGYGSDIDGDFDLSPRMAEVSPFSTRAVAQALVRRLDCPRGALPDDPDYGVDLRGLLNRGVADRDLAELEGQIQSEVTKDDRITDARATVTIVFGPPTALRVVLAVTPIDPEVSAFTLTFSVTSAELALEEIVES
jgi:hypothetical protein